MLLLPGHLGLLIEEHSISIVKMEKPAKRMLQRKQAGVYSVATAGRLLNRVAEEAIEASARAEGWRMR